MRRPVRSGLLLLSRITKGLLLAPVIFAAGRAEPYVVATQTVQYNSNTSYTVCPRVSGAQENDYIIYCFKKGDDVAVNSGPTGFTLIYTYGTSTGTDQRWEMYYRKVTASEANTADTVTHTGDVDQTTAGEILVRGVDGTTPFDTTWVTANHFQFTANQNDPVVPSITTNTDSALIITFVGHATVTATYTVAAPSGHDSLWVMQAPAAGVQNNDSYASAYLMATAGATGTMTWDATVTVGTAETYKGVIALRWDGTTYPDAPTTKAQVVRVTITE